MSREAKDVPELYVEQLFLDELPAGRRESLSVDPKVPEMAGRLAELKESDRQILGAYPPGPMAEAIRKRAAVQPERTAIRRPAVLAIGFASAAAVGLLLGWFILSVIPRDDQPAGGHGPDTVRFKGTPQLVIHRKNLGPAQPLEPGSLVHSGDQLQVSYIARDARYGVILSLDGNGQVNLHFPGQPEASTSLDPSGKRQLDHSYELDDAPAFERFFFITCPTPVAVTEILTAARRLGRQPHAIARSQPLSIPPECNQTDMLLQKAGR